MSRWFKFILVILLGSALGLAAGWEVIPLKPAGAAPDSLRIDYKTDYVLMVAEVYHANGDLEWAVARLRFLGETSLEDLVMQAILSGESHGYLEADLHLMRALAGALQDRAAAGGPSQ